MLQTAKRLLSEMLDQQVEKPPPSSPSKTLSELRQAHQIIDCIAAQIESAGNNFAPYETIQKAAKSEFEYDSNEGKRRRLAGHILTIIETLRRSMNTALPGTSMPVPDININLATRYMNIAFEITQKQRESLGAYVDVKSTHSNPDIEMAHLHDTFEALEEMAAIYTHNEELNTSKPAALNGLDHQYSMIQELTHMIPALIALWSGTNAAHEMISGIGTFIKQINDMSLRLLGWKREEYKNARVITTTGGTISNDLAVRFHLRCMGIGAGIIRVLKTDGMEILRDIPVEKEHFRRILSQERLIEVSIIGDLEPFEAFQLPLELIDYYLMLIQKKVMDEFHGDMEKANAVYREFVRRLRHQTIREGSFSDDRFTGPDGKQHLPLIIGSRELLHFTIQSSAGQSCVKADGKDKEKIILSLPPGEKGNMDFDCEINGSGKNAREIIEEAIAEGRPVLIFPIAGNSSYGSMDNFAALQTLQKYLMEKYGRKMQIHVDGAWGWPGIAMIRNTETGETLSYEEVSNIPYFSGKKGEYRYQNLRAMLETADTITFDHHKETTPYQTAALAIKNARLIAFISLGKEAPYLPFEEGIGVFDEATVKENLCSHSPESYMFAWLNLKINYGRGYMARRAEALLNAADLAEENLRSYEWLHLQDGRKIRMVPAMNSSTAIINLLFIPVGSTSLKEVEALNLHIKEEFSGRQRGKYRGLVFSSTICHVSASATLKNLKQDGDPDAIQSVRICIRNPEQLQKTTKMQGWEGKDGHFGYVVSCIQDALNSYNH